MNNKNALLDEIKTFPTLPAVTTKLIEITSNSGSSIDDVLKVINLDPSLVFEILKLANSPVFGRVKQVSSIKDALSVLGFSEIRNLVLATAVFKSFKQLNIGNRRFVKKFWEHSYLCGLAARLIAEKIKSDSSDCLIAGLIHDIGRLVISIALPKDFVTIEERSEKHLFGTYQEELEILGITHDQIGANLLTKWLFPERLISVVQYHHVCKENHKTDILPQIVNIADLLSHCSILQNNKDIDQSIFGTLIYPEHVSFFKRFDKIWDLILFQQYLDELKELKEKSAELIINA